jgi:hypothetical protein
MVDDKEKILDIQSNINTLHERSQRTKSELETHEAVCAIRYQGIQEKLEELNKMVADNNKQIADLHRIATESTVGFRTIMFLGGIAVGLAGFIYTLQSIIKG